MRERDVLDYLRDNPHFFRRHQLELSRRLRLAERDVVDLTGRQLVVLRDENSVMRNQLQAWYTNAADNEGVIEFLHHLALALLKVTNQAGQTSRVLNRATRSLLEIDLCKLCDLRAKTAPELSKRDRQRLEECMGVLRTTTPLPSLQQYTARGEWQAFLYVPVWAGRSLRAVIVCAAEAAREFPRDAQPDYAIRLAELIGAALAREPK